MTISSRIRSASLAVFCVAALGVVHPAYAGIHGVRAWGGGRQIGHAGATFRNGQGGITHVRGTRASGPNGTAAHGAYTSVNPNGSVTHQGATKVTGANGGSLAGNNSFTHNPDGSAQGSFNRSAQGAAGGSYNSSGSYARDANGNWSSDRQTSASGARGSYDGSTVRSNGTGTHDTTIHGANGGTYNGQTGYTKGQGVTHTGSCTNASGASVTCPR
jgi:hypothetical protein